jgi:hypothetical protein
MILHEVPELSQDAVNIPNPGLLSYALIIALLQSKSQEIHLQAAS